MSELADRTQSDPPIRQIGEEELLTRILARLPEAVIPLGPGDDAAVIPAPDGRVVVTTDTMIEGPDFRLEWSSPQDLGYKAVTSNLSDIVAMGAKPTGLVIALGIPNDLPLSFATGIADGVAAALAAHAPGVGVAGGDLTTSQQVVIAVTAFGSLAGAAPVLRSGAAAGDALAVSGRLGLAAAGLQLLAEGVDAASLFDERLALSDAARDLALACIRAQLAPTPDLTAGASARAASVTAMMDLSDGPLRDAQRLARASGVCINIETARFTMWTTPLAQMLREVLRLSPDAAAAQALELELSGGEEQTMLATFPDGAPLGRGFTRIGTVLPPRSATWIRVDGDPTPARGWDPYASSAATTAGTAGAGYVSEK